MKSIAVAMHNVTHNKPVFTSPLPHFRHRDPSAQARRHGSVHLQSRVRCAATLQRRQRPRRQGTVAAAGRQPGLAMRTGRELEGCLLLLLVSALWGSYGPALRVAYNLPGPPTPVAVTLIGATIELLVLLCALLAKRVATRRQAHESAEHTPQPQRSWLGMPASVAAGLEVGLYNSAANWCEISGLALTTATRSAFLIQSSILFTPGLSILAGMAVSRSLWLASLLALAGTAIITRDGGDTGAQHVLSTGQAVSAGDALAVLASLSYSFATVRMPVWLVRHAVPPLQLALGKAAFLVIVTAVAAAVQAARLAAAGLPLSALWPGWRQPQGWAIMVWGALGPGALASVLHVQGQRLVSPAAARVVFCSVPLFAALISAAALPGEAVGRETWVGGAVVAAAGLVAALAPAEEEGGRQRGSSVVTDP